MSWSGLQLLYLSFFWFAGAREYLLCIFILVSCSYKSHLTTIFPSRVQLHNLMFAKFTEGLSALAGYNTAFPYIVEDPHPSAWGHWTHYRGRTKDDGCVVSIFKICAQDPNDRQLVAARNGIKRLKLLRHPNILPFIASHETIEKGATVIYLVTQACSPMKTVLDELNLKGQHRSDTRVNGFTIHHYNLHGYKNLVTSWLLNPSNCISIIIGFSERNTWLWASFTWQMRSAFSTMTANWYDSKLHRHKQSSRTIISPCCHSHN